MSGSLSHVARTEARVLVVDSDAAFAQEVSRALRRAGYSVFEATSFGDAKRLWRNEAPQVLISDVRLGEFNGLQLLMRAKEDQPETVAIITCAFNDVVLEAETLRLGGMFLVKPIEPQTLVAAVQSGRQTSLGRRAAEPPMPVAPTTPGNAWISFDGQATPIERRIADRRRLPDVGFTPERRVGERRRRDTAS